MKMLFYEVDGQWAALARRRLPSDVSIVEVRELDELWQKLPRFGAAIIALELTAENAEASLAALTRLAREYPNSIAIVLATREMANWEMLCREADAAHFLTSTRQIGDIA